MRRRPLTAPAPRRGGSARAVLLRTLLALALASLATPAAVAGIVVTSTSSAVVRGTTPAIVLVAGSTAACETSVGSDGTSGGASVPGASRATTLPGCLKLTSPSKSPRALQIRLAEATEVARIATFRLHTGSGQGTTHVEIRDGAVAIATGPWTTVNNQISLDFTHKETPGPASVVTVEVVVARAPTTPLGGTYAVYEIAYTLGGT